MLTREHYYYFQPEYIRNGESSGELPEGLWDFQAFLTEDICNQWLKNYGYNPSDFAIHLYKDDDIEEVTIIDENGENLDRIEDLTDEEIAERIEDTVIWNAGSIDNLHTCQQPDESWSDYNARITNWAIDLINDAIADIECDNDYNFQSYAGKPETEWYDEARGIVLDTILDYMTEENDDEE